MRIFLCIVIMAVLFMADNVYVSYGFESQVQSGIFMAATVVTATLAIAQDIKELLKGS